jgi:AraC-like DNA-binding protein
VALYMDCTGGITHRRLRAMTGGSGMISAGRATALLWRLRSGGMIEAAPDDSRRFIATQVIRRIMRERLRVEFAPLALLDPDIAPLMARFDEPQIFDALMVQLGEDLMGSAGRPDTRLQDMGRLLAHNCGIMILYALIAAMGEDSQFPPRGSARVSVSALARRFGLSRSHVLRVVRMIEEMGWLISEGDLRTLGPRLGAELRMFHALMALGALRAACRALRGPIPAPAAA